MGAMPVLQTHVQGTATRVGKIWAWKSKYSPQICSCQCQSHLDRFLFPGLCYF